MAGPVVLALALALAPIGAGQAGATGTSIPPQPLSFTRVYLDGERVPLPVPAVVCGSTAMVPARALFERLGAKVVWDGAKRVTVTTDTHIIDLWLDQTWAAVDGTIVSLEVAPFLLRSRVMVPARFVAERMGLGVAWDSERRAVRFSSDPYTYLQPDQRSAAILSQPIKEVTLAFAGDTLIGFRIGDLIAANGTNWPWGGVAQTLSAADLTMVNLECCVSTRGSPMPNKKWTFRAAPSALEGVKNAGIDVVSVANNHVLDFGQQAFLDTLSYLDQYGIARVGGGANAAEARRPAILEAGGFKVGYLAATAIYPVGEWVAGDTRPGILPSHSEATVMQAVKDLKKQADFVVVSVHWGVEREHSANSYQQRYGRALVDAGADLVIGHHPHVLQGMEVYKDKLIAYSLGNFVFTTATRDGQDSGILLVTLDDQGLAAARLLPVFTDSGRPELETGSDYTRILTSLNTWSKKWGTVFDPNGWIMLP